ncbi:MAG: carboxypeptidase-like regulatory domain-containing protein [Caldilineaceae bacterium]
MNAQFKNPQFDPLENWVNERAHNWVIHRAFRNIDPHWLEEALVHYGVAFADYPWMGRPESFSPDAPRGERIASVREDLYGEKIAEATNSVHQDWIELRYPWADVDHPNLYLNVRFSLHPNIILIHLTEYFAEIKPLDQLSHSRNNKPLAIDGTDGFEGVVASDSKGEGGWKINAIEYGLSLYELAQRFWPGFDPEPSLNELYMLPNLDQSLGKLYIDLRSAEGGFLVAPVDMEVTVPTFLGGNPFITTSAHKATWPIWVSDNFSVEALTQDRPGRSRRASAIYLGWALHLLHEMANPFHAVNRIGKYHTCDEPGMPLGSEEELDSWILPQKFFDYLPVQGHYQCSDRSVYVPYDGEDGLLSVNDIYNKFERLANLSAEFYEDVHPAKRIKPEQTIAAYEYLVDAALKESIDLITHLDQPGGFKGVVRGQYVGPVSNAELTFVQGNDVVKAQTDEEGKFSVIMPAPGKYTCRVFEPQRPDIAQPSRTYKIEHSGWNRIDVRSGYWKMDPVSNVGSANFYIHKGYQPTTFGPMKRPEIFIYNGFGSILIASGTTDKTGAFAADLPYGKYQLKVVYPGQIKSEFVEFEVNQESQTVDVKLTDTHLL